MPNRHDSLDGRMRRVVKVASRRIVVRMLHHGRDRNRWGHAVSVHRRRPPRRPIGRCAPRAPPAAVDRILAAACNIMPMSRRSASGRHLSVSAWRSWAVPRHKSVGSVRRVRVDVGVLRAVGAPPRFARRGWRFLVIGTSVDPQPGRRPAAERAPVTPIDQRRDTEPPRRRR
jgi:hypothetical protein